MRTMCVLVVGLEREMEKSWRGKRKDSTQFS